jgi:hypothetical protein
VLAHRCLRKQLRRKERIGGEPGGAGFSGINLAAECRRRLSILSRRRNRADCFFVVFKLRLEYRRHSFRVLRRHSDFAGYLFHDGRMINGRRVTDFAEG